MQTKSLLGSYELHKDYFILADVLYIGRRIAYCIMIRRYFWEGIIERRCGGLLHQIVDHEVQKSINYWFIWTGVIFNDKYYHICHFFINNEMLMASKFCATTPFSGIVCWNAQSTCWFLVYHPSDNNHHWLGQSIMRCLSSMIILFST